MPLSASPILAPDPSLEKDWRLPNRYNADEPVSPVRMRIVSARSDTKILPSPICPVWAERTIVSTAARSLPSSTTTSILTFGHEVDGVLRAAVDFGVALLPAEAADLGHRHARNALLGEGVLHVLELVMANNRFDFLHRLGSYLGQASRA